MEVGEHSSTCILHLIHDGCILYTVPVYIAYLIQYHDSGLGFTITQFDGLATHDLNLQRPSYQLAFNIIGPLASSTSQLVVKIRAEVGRIRPLKHMYLQ